MKDWMRSVWNAPANYNRAARREARLWGRIWAWDNQATGTQPTLPRYVRRHFVPELMLNATTRRQRRHRARIQRLMRQFS